MRVRGTRFFYTFRSTGGIVVSCLRGSSAPKIVSGGGGWEVVARPRRVALTQWQGQDPFEMDVPILFDGHSEGSSVEQDIATLNSMQIGGPFDAPDTVTLDGAVPLRGLTWVINGIEWGDEVYWEQNGSNGQPYRTRQDAVVHLIHYTREERVKIQATNTLPNIYVVSNGGETMRSIAKSMYGNASKWKQIREANPNIRDPNKIKIGTKVRVP